MASASLRIDRLARTARAALLACLVGTVAACGTEGPAGPPTATTASTAPAVPAGQDTGDATDAPAIPASPTAAPTAPTLTVATARGRLSLAWTASPDTSAYRIQKRLGDAAEWADDGLALAAASLSAERDVPVAEWALARFRVRACNPVGCTASAEVRALAPMAATVRYLKASSTRSNDTFGGDVALSADGNTLAVSANYQNGLAGQLETETGAVYIFVRAAGAWTQQAELRGANIVASDYFGATVALSTDGNTLAVGAIFEDSAETGTTGTGADDSAPASGAVYVFERSAGAWTQQAYLKASNTGQYDIFGTSIAVSADGRTLAVAAAYEDSAETGTTGTGANEGRMDSGAVYVFVRGAGSWTQQAYLKASNPGQADHFGLGLALSADGTTLAVGASDEDSAETGTGGSGADESAPDSGAVYVFTSAGGTWSQQAYLKASNTGAGDRFGGRVALSADGHTLAVGAGFEDGAATGTGADDAVPDSGAVYVFVRTGAGWTQQAYLKAANAGPDDQFGVMLALSADGLTLAVGAGNEDSAETGVAGTGADDSASDSGAVYVFVRNGGTWHQRAYLKAGNTGAGDGFGFSLALSADGKTLAVGAYAEDSAETGTAGTGADDSAPNSGAVYVF